MNRRTLRVGALGAGQIFKTGNFCQEQAANAPDIWQGGDQIIRTLYAPFRTS